MIAGDSRILKAYGTGAVTFLTPRLLGLLFARLHRRRRINNNSNDVNKKRRSNYEIISHFFRQSVELHRFPAFCGFTVALHHVLRRALAPLPLPPTLASWLAGALAAAGGIKLLNFRETGDMAGRTLDLTLFTLARAADVVVGGLWERRKRRRVAAGKWGRAEELIGYLADPAVFAVSSGVIMFAWFYSPEKLPPAYTKQITKMANADMRLITTLQTIRNGTFVYGKAAPPGAERHPLETYCEDLGLPKEWGNPEVTVPIPCEVVHGGLTKSCELYALSRTWTAIWKTALPIYLSLNLIRFLRPTRPSRAALFKALIGALRSSAFLGSFIGIFWYIICLTRTRIGPCLLLPSSSTAEGRLKLENLAIKLSCLMCGWSILVEYPARRTEIAFFVVPRAMAALLPRRYPKRWRWLETAVFAASAGVVLEAVGRRPKRVRGVLGKLLGTILEG